MDLETNTFNVFVWDFNSDMIEPYDVLPHFREEYRNLAKKPNSNWRKCPKTFEEFKEFVKEESIYKFWGRCEYEMIVHGWPVKKNTHKIDVHEQIMANIDVISRILWDEINNKK